MCNQININPEKQRLEFYCDEFILGTVDVSDEVEFYQSLQIDELWDRCMEIFSEFFIEE
jgi:hypothetical protein